MANILSKQPPVIAPWPPAGTGLVKKTVNAGEDLAAFCKRVGITVREFMDTNFKIDLGDSNWQFYFNFYMSKNGIAKAWTPKGNCIFLGGETFYVKPAKTDLKAPRDRGEVVQWFLQDMMPQRTIGPGNVTNLGFMAVRGGKVLDRLSGKAPDPNGICGSVAEFMVDQYQNFGGKTPFTLGYILWMQAKFFTHVANVLVPRLTVLEYTRDLVSGAVIGEAPEGGVFVPFGEVENWTVLDLYFKKTTTVGQWWRDVSYLGWGTLTIDPSGEYINS